MMFFMLGHRILFHVSSCFNSPLDERVIICFRYSIDKICVAPSFSLKWHNQDIYACFFVLVFPRSGISGSKDMEIHCSVNCFLKTYYILWTSFHKRFNLAT